MNNKKILSLLMLSITTTIQTFDGDSFEKFQDMKRFTAPQALKRPKLYGYVRGAGAKEGIDYHTLNSDLTYLRPNQTLEMLQGRLANLKNGQIIAKENIKDLFREMVKKGKVYTPDEMLLGEIEMSQRTALLGLRDQTNIEAAIEKGSIENEVDNWNNSHPRDETNLFTQRKMTQEASEKQTDLDKRASFYQKFGQRIAAIQAAEALLDAEKLLDTSTIWSENSKSPHHNPEQEAANQKKLEELDEYVQYHKSALAQLLAHNPDPELHKETALFLENMNDIGFKGYQNDRPFFTLNGYQKHSELFDNIIKNPDLTKLYKKDWEVVKNERTIDTDSNNRPRLWHPGTSNDPGKMFLNNPLHTSAKERYWKDTKDAEGTLGAKEVLTLQREAEQKKWDKSLVGKVSNGFNYVARPVVNSVSGASQWLKNKFLSNKHFTPTATLPISRLPEATEPTNTITIESNGLKSSKPKKSMWEERGALGYQEKQTL